MYRGALFTVYPFAIALITCMQATVPAKAQITFTNSNPITIPDFGTADPYPSTITVSGYMGSITGITVTLHGFTHSYTDDLAVLFTGPGGQKTLLFNGAGLDDLPGTSVTNITLTFDDAAAETLPENDNFGTGTYRPGLDQYITDSLAAPAPLRPYATNFDDFLGQEPDGTYSLYIEDFVPPDGGSIASWSITIHGITPIPEPATVLAGPAVLLAGAGFVRRLRRRRAEAAAGV
jgi:subtilisin-like proprotein convertase family protein